MANATTEKILNSERNQTAKMQELLANERKRFFVKGVIGDDGVYDTFAEFCKGVHDEQQVMFKLHDELVD